MTRRVYDNWTFASFIDKRTLDLLDSLTTSVGVLLTDMNPLSCRFRRQRVWKVLSVEIVVVELPSLLCYHFIIKSCWTFLFAFHL